MIALPLPLVFALALFFLLASHLSSDRRATFFSALLFFCALQGLIVSLVQYYDVTGLRPLQPVTATVVPPLAWLTFHSTAVRAFDFRRDGVHLLVPLLTALCEIFIPVMLDAVVSGIFLVYGAAILIRLMARSGALPLMRFESGPIPARVWKAIGAALIVSALGDVFIAVALAYDQAWLRSWTLNLSSTLALFCIGVLSLSKEAVGEPETSSSQQSADETATQLIADKELMDQLERFMREHKPYIDPDLTLARLSRRMQTPIKHLSAAINRTSGENVSRYVNRFRIDHACDLLRGGASVTNAMLSSGFNTKSNFNREFSRILGQPPSQWLQDEENAQQND